MKYFLLSSSIALLLFISCGTGTKNNEPDHDYPNDDAVFLTLVKEYTLNDDKTIDFHYSHKLKYLTHYAFHRLYGETFVVYNPMFSRLTINKCETTMADGRIITAPKNAFNEVLPQFADHAADYNHLREMVITHTGLEKSAVVELDYTIHSSEEYLPFLSGAEWMWANAPVEEMQIIVNVPIGKELKFFVINDSVAPEVTENKLYRTYTWTNKNLAARSNESSQLDPEPRLFFSTAKDFGEARNFMTSQNAFKYELTEEIKKVVGEITSNNKDPFEIARKLQKYVVNDINLFQIPLQNAAFRVRKPEEIWNSNGGTELEKTLLLIAMLKEAGLRANPVMLQEVGSVNSSVGSLHYLQNFYVQLIPENENQTVPYFSAIELNEPYKMNYSDIEVIPFDQESMNIANASETNLIISDAVVAFQSPKSLTGNINVRFTKELNPYVKFYESKESAVGLFEGVSKVNSLKTDREESEVDYSVNTTDPCKISGKYMFWKVPHATNGIESLHLKELPERRATTLKINHLIKESYSWYVKLPWSYEMTTSQTQISESNDVGTVIIEITKDQYHFKLKREIELKKTAIDTADYDKLKKLIHLWYNNNYREMVFEQRGSATVEAGH